VSAGEDKTVRVWDSRSFKLLATLEGHRDSVMCLAVSPDGRSLAAGSKEEIRVWKLK
jgi:WD40 repeat protein